MISAARWVASLVDAIVEAKIGERLKKAGVQLEGRGDEVPGPVAPSLVKSVLLR